MNQLNAPEAAGLIHIYTGEGKGKTTAAIGLTIRCAGSGGRVVFCQPQQRAEHSAPAAAG